MGTIVKAQSIDEGKNFLYYDRLISAKNAFNAIINKDTKNAGSDLLARQKDYPAALAALDGILAVDPENSYAKSTSEAIKKIMSRSNKSS